MTHQDFTDYLARRKEASDAFVTGDVKPLLSVSTTTAPASIFGPAGTIIAAPDEVNVANTQGAASFTGADRNDLEPTHSGASGDLGWWTGVQRSVVHVKDRTEPVAMDLRVTELYRREDGGWKLFHRHADTLQS